MHRDLIELSDEARPAVRPHAVDPPVAARVSVEIATPDRFAAVERDWDDLVGHALAANAFLEPAIVAAAAAQRGARVVVLLAWSAASLDRPGRLIGAWALARRPALSLLPLAVLKSPVHDHAFLGRPVLARDAAAEALSGMLDAVAGAPALPKIVRVGNLDADGPTAAIFDTVMMRRGSRWTRFETRRRPMLLKAEAGGGATPVSASRAKALRQRRRRLAARGAVAWTEHRSGPDFETALEAFLALEASGWKARRSARGQAILRRPGVTSFFRLALSALAARRRAWITALRVDGRAVAMQVSVRSGDTAFTWKTAYDEELRACAPGLLLHREVTDRLIAEPDLAAVDSCNQSDAGYMAEFWSGRRAVSDLIVDVRPRKVARVALIGAAERLRRRLLEVARAARSGLRARRRRADAATPPSTGGAR